MIAVASQQAHEAEKQSIPHFCGSPAHWVLQASVPKVAAKGLLPRQCFPCSARSVLSLQSLFVSPATVVETLVWRSAGLSPCCTTCWPTSHSRASWVKFGRVLKTTLLEENFTITTFTRRGKSVIKSDLPDCELKLTVLKTQRATNTLIYHSRLQPPFIKTGICAAQWIDKKPR